MKKYLILLLTAYTLQAHAADPVVGLWKITNVKIEGNRPVVGDDSNGCYLCDVYQAKLGLNFSANGQLNYENDRNPQPVYYKVENGKLILSTVKDFKGATSADLFVFNVQIKENEMILSHNFGTHQEIYTLTK